MNCCSFGKVGDIEVKKSTDIDKFLKDEGRRLEEAILLLLLGAGESGKSTIAKQMRILHREGFSEEDRLTFKVTINNNILGNIVALINATRDFHIDLLPTSLEPATRLSVEEEETYLGPLPPEKILDVKTLWADPAIQQAYSRSSEFQISDSAAYYFSHLDRIGNENYIPSVEDVLRSRAKTTGIIEIEFEVEDVRFRLVDVGGQRSERKKWMHCFQDVTAVIFCVALSEYDLRLYEDEKTNRMHESLKLFREVCNSPWFENTAMILFLNKSDLFEVKINKVDLNVCFPEYNGGCTSKPALDYIKARFASQNTNPKKPVYPHVTCATDTSNIELVFHAVRDIVLRKALDSAGIV